MTKRSFYFVLLYLLVNSMYLLPVLGCTNYPQGLIFYLSVISFCIMDKKKVLPFFGDQKSKSLMLLKLFLF